MPAAPHLASVNVPCTQLLICVSLEAADVSARHRQAPHVAVDKSLHTPPQVLPGGGVVARPVGSVTARARECRPELRNLTRGGGQAQW
jgi:hypothetical protein